MVVTDWFHPQWLAVSIGILLLCGADAILTLTLISHGAIEINPLMEPLVQGSGKLSRYWKIGLTAMGVVMLTVLARLRSGAGRWAPCCTWFSPCMPCSGGLRALSFT